MKLINPSYEILTQKPGLEGIYEQIELAGRTCYKSKRPEGQTAKDFVDRMIKSLHWAMLEHGTVYLKVPNGIDIAGNFLDDVATWTKCKLVREEMGNSWWAITTNYRRIIELGYEKYLQYLCEPTEYHEKRVTVRFTTSVGIGRELTRHRKFSFAQESTRYCKYNSDKFENQITYIIPTWAENIQEGDYDGITDDYDNIPQKELTLLFGLSQAEDYYLRLTDIDRAAAQEAREVLPLATKAELIMTGFVSDWGYLFLLRTSIASTGKPHPDMCNLVDPLYKKFIENNWI